MSFTAHLTSLMVQPATVVDHRTIPWSRERAA
jgi:hypothetical protein